MGADMDAVGITSLIISAISLIFAFGDCVGTCRQLE